MWDELSEEVVTLSITSPNPMKRGSPTGARSGEEGEFDSVTEFDDDFLQQIDANSEKADLAAIPVHFYTPG